LQRFDYSNPEELRIAALYRDAQLPFKLYNFPDLNKITHKWTDTYLKKNMAREAIHVEKSKNNHFMYWNTRFEIEDYKPPTEVRFV